MRDKYICYNSKTVKVELRKGWDKNNVDSAIKFLESVKKHTKDDKNV